MKVPPMELCVTAKAVRIFLLSAKGSFLEWGAGCAICVHPSPGTYRVSASGGSTFIWLAEFVRPKASELPTLESGHVDTETPEYAAYLEDDNVAARKAAGCAALYLQAILGTSEGALLRWDSERGQVVDELDEDESAFADDPVAILEREA